jgi:hypothetical protein
MLPSVPDRAAGGRLNHPLDRRAGGGRPHHWYISLRPVVGLIGSAPVAQGIEHRPPEAVAQVRILPGAPTD